MKILIDNGHGENTPGKRSPDGALMEYSYTREIATEVVSRLRRMAYDAELLVPERYDVTLLERVHRVNVKCQTYGAPNVIVVSIHCNAAGNGAQWMTARGWECWTSEGITQSDILADYLFDAADKAFSANIPLRRHLHEKRAQDKEKNFTILKSTLCPAVLTENLFMDNHEDVCYLLSDKGREAVIHCHVNGIINYINHINAR